mgnify:CR=1 FL=1
MNLISFSTYLASGESPELPFSGKELSLFGALQNSTTYIDPLKAYTESIQQKLEIKKEYHVKLIEAKKKLSKILLQVFFFFF